MKASELRIGNYVMYAENISTISSIDKKRTVLADYNRPLNFSVTFLNQIKPIPLTQEWLINFGFKNKPDIDNGTYHTTVFEKDGVALLFFMGNFDECSINGDLEFDFTYVHTLQNFWHLFRKQDFKIKQL